jgi:hypothetical protein
MLPAHPHGTTLVEASPPLSTAIGCDGAAFAHRVRFQWRPDGIASSLLLIGSNDRALFGEIAESAAEGDLATRINEINGSRRRLTTAILPKASLKISLLP